MPPLVAIVMRAKNEMPHVRRTLEALQTQTVGDVELTAVDSGSTDGTLEQLETHCNRVKQILPEHYVPGNVLNNAIGETSSQIIVLLNADAIPESDEWLENLVRPISENQADATFSKQVTRSDAFFIVAYDYARAYDASGMKPDFFSAVACAFKRELWESHPFPAEGYAEDAAWAKACLTDGARIRFVDDSSVEHSHNYTLSELYRKRYRQALTLDEKPNLIHLSLRCLKELVRDFFHALSRLKISTIPYNIIYRLTIYRAVYNGMKS